MSSSILEFEFKLVEKIENIKVTAETSYSGLLNLESSSVDASENEEVKFLITLDAGSHVTYSIDYGDGSATESKSSSSLFAKDTVIVFDHKYNMHGVYKVNVSAKNFISFDSKVLPFEVYVFEVVNNSKHRIENVNYDKELYGVDIFASASEISALLFGSKVTLK